MTAADHAAVGAALGYPSCCIDQWVAEHVRGDVQQARRRGLVYCGIRTAEDAAEVLVNARVGHPIVFVPCDFHATYLTPGYSVYGVPLSHVTPGPIPEPVILPPEKVLVA